MRPCTSLPAGEVEVEYQVTARRASLVGDPSVPLIVRLGGAAESPAITAQPRAA